MTMENKKLTIEEMELVSGGMRGMRIKDKSVIKLMQDVTTVIKYAKKLIQQNGGKLFDKVVRTYDEIKEIEKGPMNRPHEILHDPEKIHQIITKMA